MGKTSQFPGAISKNFQLLGELRCIVLVFMALKKYWIISTHNTYFKSNVIRFGLIHWFAKAPFSSWMSHSKFIANEFEIRQQRPQTIQIQLFFFYWFVCIFKDNSERGCMSIYKCMACPMHRRVAINRYAISAANGQQHLLIFNFIIYMQCIQIS